MKNIRVLTLLLLLGIGPSTSAKSSESISDVKNGFIGAATGIGLSTTTLVSINTAKWIASKITNRFYINYVPAVIVGTILEAAALFGWEELRAYATSDSDLAFWAHYGSAGFATAVGLYKPQWTILAVLFALKNSISGTKSKVKDDSDYEEEEMILDLP